MIRHVFLCTLVCAGLPASAGEWIVGVGRADFSSGGASGRAALAVEVHGAPLLWPDRLPLGLAAAATAHDNGDYWVGAGVAVVAPLGGGPWFVEASVMSGLYHNGEDATDLGHVVEFRSLAGLGYRFGEALAISLAIDHKSNAGLGEDNPGVDTVSLRLRRRF